MFFQCTFLAKMDFLHEYNLSPKVGYVTFENNSNRAIRVMALSLMEISSSPLWLMLLN